MYNVDYSECRSGERDSVGSKAAGGWPWRRESSISISGEDLGVACRGTHQGGAEQRPQLGRKTGQGHLFGQYHTFFYWHHRVAHSLVTWGW